MKQIDVPASTPYRVEIGGGIASSLPVRINALCPTAERIMIVSDDHVYPLHGKPLVVLLRGCGYGADAYVLPHGEASKNEESLIALLHALAERRFARSDALVALGGGMIGDLTGFAAAVYMRGMPYFQIPTTLLAAVDSSVGGKTAVDLKAGKNLMGAFWQPKAVLCDTELLETLPEPVFSDGCAEAVKTALLFDPPLFDTLSRMGREFGREEVIARCVRHKSDIAARDEFDLGPRRLLNLGHTLGHALEPASNYTLSHGKAVAIGIASVCRAAAKNGYCDHWLPAEICRVLSLFGLPTETEKTIEELMPFMASDKKRAGSRFGVVVPRRVGRAEIIPMNDEELYGFMKAGLCV